MAKKKKTVAKNGRRKQPAPEVKPVVKPIVEWVREYSARLARLKELHESLDGKLGVEKAKEAGQIVLDLEKATGLKIAKLIEAFDSNWKVSQSTLYNWRRVAQYWDKIVLRVDWKKYGETLKNALTISRVVSGSKRKQGSGAKAKAETLVESVRTKLESLKELAKDKLDAKIIEDLRGCRDLIQQLLDIR